MYCPLGAPGERRWVRETWRVDGLNRGSALRMGECETTKEGMSYRADMMGDSCCDDCAWIPSVQMPQWASRAAVTIRAERVCRVQEVDAEMAGWPIDGPDWCCSAVWWQRRFDADNGRGAWLANKWVWFAEVEA